MQPSKYFQSETFQNLLRFLSENSLAVEHSGTTRESISACGKAGVFRWFVPTEFGGWGWSKRAITEGYLALAGSCLSTTFVITQRTSSVQRLSVCENDALKSRFLSQFASGELMTTVGISNLTTSGQHLTKPQLAIDIQEDSVVLEGASRWVTGAMISDHVMVGGHLDDGTELLILVPAETKGMTIEPPFQLVALSSSETGTVSFKNAKVPRDRIIAGPVKNVLKSLSHSSTGGLQTSTLAIGLAAAASDFVSDQAEKRTDLVSMASELSGQVDTLKNQLLKAADEEFQESGASTENCISAAGLRTEANSLVLRATQAAMVVAKGSGYLSTHPAGRWCREALFFLVWSCPQEVQRNHLHQIVFGTAAQ